MITAIQPVPSVYAVNFPAAPEPVSQLARSSGAELPIPDTIVSLGTKPSPPLAYDVAGVLEGLPADSTVKDINNLLTADTSTTATTATTVAALQTSLTPITASAVSNNFLVDSVAQAMANIEGNPAYANMVAGLYMSAMILRSQQASATLPNTSYVVQPISAVPRINAVSPIAGNRDAA